MSVIGGTSYEVGQAIRSHIIVAISVSLRNEIEVTNGDINKKKLLKKRMVTTPFSQKYEDGHQDLSHEKDNI